MRWIVSDDVYAETWRNLLEYSNVELALDAIERRHGPSQGAQRSNYLKQASQARVCALQAKEYFDAARSSTVFTSANHAYYGAASIASLMMLILGTGKNSLDSLRKDKKNNHHGLLFSTSCTKAQAPSGTNLLEMSFAEIAANGHFRN